MVSVLRAAWALAGLAALPLSIAHAEAAPQSRQTVGLEALPAQSLESGRCGLFLWLREAQPVFVFVAYDQPAQARIRTGGRTHDLPRTRFAGEPAYGHFERQTFSDGAVTLDLNVRFDPDRPIRDGAVVREGVLRIEGGDGWQIVAPVGGMVACKR